jgi:hypothetical protein
MQMKTTIIYHCIPIRIAKIQNADNTKCWWRWGVTGTSLLVEMQNDAATLEKNLTVSYKTKHTLNHTNQQSYSLVIYPSALNTISTLNTWTQMCIAALFIIAQT